MRTLIHYYLLILIFVSCNTRTNKGQLKDKNLENKFDQLVKEKRSDYSSIIKFRLDTLTNYSWDSVIILTPYLPIDEIEQATNINLEEIKQTGIEFDEGINVLAFIKGGKLIRYTALPRFKGDFAYSIDSNRIFTQNNCLFELERTDKKFASGKALIKVNPKIKRLVTSSYTL